jgi:hypothetical protein
LKLTSDNVEVFGAHLGANLLETLEAVLEFEMNEFFEQHANHNVHFMPKKVPTVLVAVGCFTCDEMSLFTLDRRDGRISEAVARRKVHLPPN